MSDFCTEFLWAGAKSHTLVQLLVSKVLYPLLDAIAIRSMAKL